ncbi:uncharacterized protein F4822DRAFT_407475 [Hypoxylon trugodes]|uniref:uncharacterized protein n=1 Tax=Hypoxylon trugodes TaxID=326681 RepID=UPI0021933222|nr:uncharacterized protein F4822DRAFT_407475 [Hypoxylon trugodes]KAI1387744.1 hypothetical protein F4822DRAFT_407475 [Hypoxylon trugodes]
MGEWIVRWTMILHLGRVHSLVALNGRFPLFFRECLSNTNGLCSFTVKINANCELYRLRFGLFELCAIVAELSESESFFPLLLSAMEPRASSRSSLRNWNAQKELTDAYNMDSENRQERRLTLGERAKDIWNVFLVGFVMWFLTENFYIIGMLFFFFPFRVGYYGLRNLGMCLGKSLYALTTTSYNGLKNSVRYLGESLYGLPIGTSYNRLKSLVRYLGDSLYALPIGMVFNRLGILIRYLGESLYALLISKVYHGLKDLVGKSLYALQSTLVYLISLPGAGMLIGVLYYSRMLLLMKTGTLLRYAIMGTTFLVSGTRPMLAFETDTIQWKLIFFTHVICLQLLFNAVFAPRFRDGPPYLWTW